MIGQLFIRVILVITFDLPITLDSLNEDAIEIYTWCFTSKGNIFVMTIMYLSMLILIHRSEGYEEWRDFEWSWRY